MKELAVVDDQGVVRVLMSGSVPDAVIDGRRLPRGEPAAGILLYDDMGRERSGYVTFAKSRNVVFTLDTQERQVALLAADPHDGVTAKLWNESDWVEMRSDSGGTHLNIGRDGELVVQHPPMSPKESTENCASLKREISELTPPPSSALLLQACKQRMSDADCRACLEIP